MNPIINSQMKSGLKKKHRHTKGVKDGREVPQCTHSLRRKCPKWR